MRFYNVIDEKGRFCGIDARAEEHGLQVDTTKGSYLYLRELYLEIDRKFGRESNELNYNGES